MLTRLYVEEGLSLLSLAIFSVTRLMLLLQPTLDFQIVSGISFGLISTLSAIALILAAFFLSVKKGSFVVGFVLIIIGITSIITGFYYFQLPSSPDFLGQPSAEQKNQSFTVISALGSALIVLAVLTMSRRIRERGRIETKSLPPKE